MKRLAEYADILTPNLTEACILTDTVYEEGHWPVKRIADMAEKIQEMGPDKVVVTGIRQGDFVANLVCEKGEKPRVLRSPQGRHGTVRHGRRVLVDHRRGRGQRSALCRFCEKSLCFCEKKHSPF